MRNSDGLDSGASGGEGGFVAQEPPASPQMTAVAVVPSAFATAVGVSLEDQISVDAAKRAAEGQTLNLAGIAPEPVSDSPQGEVGQRGGVEVDAVATNMGESAGAEGDECGDDEKMLYLPGSVYTTKGGARIKITLNGKRVRKSRGGRDARQRRRRQERLLAEAVEAARVYCATLLRASVARAGWQGDGGA